MIDKSKVVIGTWSLSGDYGVVDLKMIQETLEYCYNKGFREFDTAPSYGNGFMEFCLGALFGDKEDVLINTKIGNVPFNGKSFSLEDMEESFNQSLKRLRRGSVNVLFLHNPREDIKDFRLVLYFMSGLKKDGKIRQIGISLAKNYDYNIEDLEKFDVVQDDANLLDLRFLKNKFQNPKFMARSPLASGLLSGKINLNTAFPPDDHRSGWLKGERLASLLKRVDIIKGETKKEILPLARRFLLKNEKIDKVIFGVKNKRHVDGILDDLENPPLDESVEKKIINLFENDFGLVNEKQLGY